MFVSSIIEAEGGPQIDAPLEPSRQQPAGQQQISLQTGLVGEHPASSSCQEPLVQGDNIVVCYDLGSHSIPPFQGLGGQAGPGVSAPWSAACFPADAGNWSMRCVWGRGVTCYPWRYPTPGQATPSLD